MNVDIGTETPIFLFWEYLFRNFGICLYSVSGDSGAQRPGLWTLRLRFQTLRFRGSGKEINSWLNVRTQDPGKTQAQVQGSTRAPRSELGDNKAQAQNGSGIRGQDLVVRIHWSGFGG